MAEVNTAFEWNGKAFSFDLADADDVERYETALAETNVKAAEIPEGETDSARIRRECALLRTLFDGVFGEGSAEAMFGKKNNLRVMYEAFDAMIDFVAQQREAQEAERDARIERMARFSPARAAQNEPKPRARRK